MTIVECKATGKIFFLLYFFQNENAAFTVGGRCVHQRKNISVIYLESQMEVNYCISTTGENEKKCLREKSLLVSPGEF